MDLKWRLSHAQGYLLLGMADEAAAELRLLTPEERDRTDVLRLRLAILQEQSRWRALRMTAAELVRRHPEDPAGWITWAFATRRSRTLEEAEQILLEAETRHPLDATIQFNLGCYACQRGHVAEAGKRVARAIKLEPTIREVALTDPDLEPLRSTEGIP